MSRFVTKKTVEIKLSETEVIQVRAKLSFDDYQEFMAIVNVAKSESAAFIPVLLKAIVSWNLKDDDGNEVACNEENIKALDVSSIIELANLILPLYTPEKKS